MNQAAEIVPRGSSSTDLSPAVPVLLAPGIAIIPLYQLQDDLVPFDAALEDIEGQVSRAAIASQDAYQGGSDILSAIQIQLNTLEAKRVEVKKPADDFGEMVQKLTKPIKARLEEAKKTLTAKMLVWRNAEEARARAAQEVIRKQQADEAARLAAQAREQGNETTAARIEEMVAAASTAPAPRVGYANYTGKTHGKRVYWNGEVVEPMVALKAILDGKIPISAIEWNKSSLNKIADDMAKKWPEGEQRDVVHNTVYLGIKITKDEKLA